MKYEKYKHQIIIDDKSGWVSNWFSNMIEVELNINGEVYHSVESYYQSQKATNEKDRLYIASLKGPKSKKEVRKITIREDWDEIKINVMKKALISKFKKQSWKKLLLDTGNEPIIEWNNWNDRFWGVSITDFSGKNNLGKLLMDIREEFKYKSLF